MGASSHWRSQSFKNFGEMLYSSPCPSFLHLLPTATAMFPAESFPPATAGRGRTACTRTMPLPVSKLLLKHWRSRTCKGAELIQQHCFPRARKADKGLRVTQLGHGHKGSHRKKQQVLWRKKQIKGQPNTPPVACNTSGTGAKGQSWTTWGLQLCTI